MKGRFTILMIAVLAVGVLAPTTQASFILELTDFSTVVTVNDNGAGDMDPTTGAIVFVGSVGVWTTNVTTGLSKPVLGGPIPSVPSLDLNTVDVSSSAGGTLQIRLTDTGFTLPLAVGAQARLVSTIGGTTQGTVTLTQTLDRGNNNFGTGTTADPVSVTLGPFVPTAFSSPAGGVSIFAGPIVNPFSLTELAVITHTGAAMTSFDATSAVVPVPGAILLGLLGLGAAGLKLRRFV
jgi:hypothetical protein